MALGGEAKFLQGLAIELEDDRLRFGPKPMSTRPIQIIPVDMAIVFHVVRQLVNQWQPLSM